MGGIRNERSTDMNEHQVKGATNEATGKIKKEVGKLTGDTSTQASGQAREIKGKLQKDMGDAKEAVRHNERELEDRDRDLDR
jgi:uncharacterized protein YjbJ (UPF0337 family)